MRRAWKREGAKERILAEKGGDGSKIPRSRGGREGRRDRFLRPGERKPYTAAVLLAAILLGCLLADFIAPYDPGYMSLGEISRPPGGDHPFGTDTLGRDLFSAIWYGGRISLLIGLGATLISTVMAVIYGTAAGLTSRRLDDGMMRLTEIFMSVPQLLLVMFLQAVMGEATVFSLAVVIGVTGWMAVAKMVRSEVKQLRNAGFVLAARTMGAGFFYILRKHLMPNFLSAILFMVVTNIGSAIAMESTLSFLGLGLSMNQISWGSLLSLSQRAMLTGAWWVVLIPGVFLVATLVCVTELGEYLRMRNRRDRLV